MKRSRRPLLISFFIGLCALLLLTSVIAGLTRAEEKCGYIDKTGTLVIPLQFQQFAVPFPFSEGLAQIRMGDFLKFGYIDKTGTLVIPPQFAVAMPFSEGLAQIQTEEGGKWGYINKSGKVIIPLQFKSVDRFSEGLAAVCNKSSTRLDKLE